MDINIEVILVVNAKCYDAPDPFLPPYEYYVSINASSLSNSTVRPFLLPTSNATNATAYS